jgi:hypothetical protein
MRAMWDRPSDSWNYLKGGIPKAASRNDIWEPMETQQSHTKQRERSQSNSSGHPRCPGGTHQKAEGTNHQPPHERCDMEPYRYPGITCSHYTYPEVRDGNQLHSMCTSQHRSPYAFENHGPAVQAGNRVILRTPAAPRRYVNPGAPRLEATTVRCTGGKLAFGRCHIGTRALSDRCLITGTRPRV